MLEAVIVIFSCAPTYFTCVFLILSLGLLKKNSFSFDQWLFWTNFNPPGSPLFVYIEKKCRHSAYFGQTGFFLAMELEGIIVLIGTIQI